MRYDASLSTASTARTLESDRARRLSAIATEKNLNATMPLTSSRNAI